VSVTAGNTGIVINPTPGTDTFTVSLGTPTASTLGGIKSLSAVSNNFVTGLSTLGELTYAQPSFTNLSGTIADTQLPYATATNAGAIKVGANLSISATGVLSSTGGGSSVLGTVVGTPSPYSNSSSTTGLYSTTATSVSIGISGVNKFTVDSTETSLYSKATGSTTARTIADHFKDNYNAKDFGVVCNGSTNDTAAFNNALQTISSAGGGVLNFHGTCMVCGLTIYRNTLLDGGSISESELKRVGSCASHTVMSESFTTNTGTGKYYGNDASVPSWFGVRNTRIDGNWDGVSGRHGIAFYGPSQIIDNVYVYNASDYGIYTEDSNNTVGYWSGGWRYQEESWFHNIYSVGNGEGGWRFKGPHDATIVKYIGSYNQTYGFYQDSGATWNGVIDNIVEMHTYANVDYKGMYFGAGVIAIHLLSDGDNIEFGPDASNSQVTNLTQWYCGHGNLDCLTVNSDSLVVSNYFGSLDDPTGTKMINWVGNYGVLSNANLEGSSTTGANTGLYVSGDAGSFTNLSIKNFSATGSKGLELNGALFTRVSGVLDENKTNLTYSSGGDNVIDLTISTNTGQTAISGTAATSDEFNIRYGGITSGSYVTLGTSSTPASSTEACTVGKFKWDASYLYVCTSSNTWKRATLGAF
jgi:hypothetical protein